MLIPLPHDDMWLIASTYACIEMNTMQFSKTKCLFPIRLDVGRKGQHSKNQVNEKMKSHVVIR